MLDVGGECLFWKIDWYDHPVRGRSADASEAAVTVRVMTVMPASDL